VAETFAELYAPLLKEVFTRLARENMERGSDGLTCAVEYAWYAVIRNERAPLIKPRSKEHLHFSQSIDSAIYDS